MCNLQPIKFIANENALIQLNRLKKQIVKHNIVLGNDNTQEMASILTQIEKLIGYYDSKKLSSRFKAFVDAFEKNLSSVETDIDQNLKQIKIDYKNTKSNKRKKELMFSLLFLHLNVLVNEYHQRYNTSRINSKLNKTVTPEIDNKVIIDETIEEFDFFEKKITDSEQNIENLTNKQQIKYFMLKKKYQNTPNQSEKNKLRANLDYYYKLINK